MNSILNEMITSFNDPQNRHAAIVHMPVALGMLGILFTLLSAIFAAKSPALRWVAVGAYALMAVAAWQGTESGEEAEHNITITLSAEVEERLEEHEHKADWIPRFAAGLAVLLVVGVVKKPVVRHGAGVLAVGGSLFLAGWTAYTAHLGGTLVYDHGVGQPPSVVTAGLATGDDPRAAYFIESVLPVLSENCMGCHKPSSLERVGGLDQTSIAGLLKGGASGPGVVPGHPDESLIIRAARHEIENLEMPPKKDKLSDESIAILVKWIADGAVWGGGE